MPPRTRSGVQDISRFLFVNQDATSVSGKATDPTLNQSKQSHVQRQYFARKRQARLQGFDPSALRSGGRQDSVQADFDECNGEAVVEHQRSNSTYATFSCRPATFTRACQPKDVQNDILEYREDAGFLDEAAPGSADFSHHLAANREVPQPRPGYALDPFTGMTLKLHPAAPTLIQYYTETMIPRIFAVDKRAANDSARRHLHAFQKDMESCLTDETQLFALLASSMVHMNRFERHMQLPGIKVDDKERAPLYFKTRAMASVRRQLADCNLDLGLFQVVYRLMATERCLGNHEEAKTHFRALFALVKALGGVHSLDSYNKERLIHSDLFEAAQSLKSPDLPLTWDPGNLPPDTMLQIAPPELLQVLGSGFLNIELSKLFHADMLDIFSALTTLVHMTVYSWTPTAHLTTDDLSWQTLRRAAIEHRLLSFPSTHNEPGDHNFFQECTRVATLFWIAMYLADPVRINLMAPFTFLLRQTLERSGLQSLWYPHSTLLLWIATTGAFIAKKGDEYDWFATMAAKVATYLEVTRASDLKKALQPFLYVDGVQQQVLAKLAGEFDKYLRLSRTRVRYYDLDTSPAGCLTDTIRYSP
jgi:hypothetical protein